MNELLNLWKDLICPTLDSHLANVAEDRLSRCLTRNSDVPGTGIRKNKMIVYLTAHELTLTEIPNNQNPSVYAKSITEGDTKIDRITSDNIKSNSSLSKTIYGERYLELMRQCAPRIRSF